MKAIKEFFDFSGLNGQKRLKEILHSNAEERGNKLKKYAEELGAVSPLPMANRVAQEENEIIKQIHNVLRTKREEGLWKFAFLSAIGSVISAITAIIVVIANK
jgi:hypothetical protein